MPKITWDDLYTNFKSIYPNLGRQSLRFQPYGYMMILVYLTDGSRMIYDDLQETSEDVGLIFRTNSSSHLSFYAILVPWQTQLHIF